MSDERPINTSPAALAEAVKVASQLGKEGNTITAVDERITRGGGITGGATVITEPTSRDQSAINAQKAAFKAARNRPNSETQR